MSIEGATTALRIVLSAPKRIFLWPIAGEGLCIDWRNGQVVCPKCLAHGMFSHMMYDRHLEIPHKQGIPGCAVDRFFCRICFYNTSTNGRVGKLLNRHNPFRVFTLSNVWRYCFVKTRRWWHIFKSRKRSCV